MDATCASCLPDLAYHNHQPPSPMDFSYGFLMFQCGNHDTRERLEFYQSFIMRLLGELKTQRETVCASCQQKCVTTRSGNAAPDGSMRPLKQLHVGDASPRTTETDIFWTPAANPCSSSPPINDKIASVSSSPVQITTEQHKFSNESNDRMFYAERDALGDTTLNVTFVDSFRLEKPVVRCLRFSLDGRFLAAGTGTNDKNGSIVIYEGESRKKHCELREYATRYGSHKRPLAWQMCFSSDGRYLAILDMADRIVIWDVPKKRIRCIFQGSYEMYDLCFSPDGRLVVFQTHGTTVMLNMRDNSRRMAYEGRCFDFNPCGRLIAIGDDYVLLILDVRTGKAVKRWNGHGTPPYCVKFNLDGRGLLCAYNDIIEQWDVSDAEPVLIRKFDFQERLYRTSISPDHRLLAFHNVLFGVSGGKRQFTLQGHIDDNVLCVEFGAAGTFLVIGDLNGFVSFWTYAYS